MPSLKSLETSYPILDSNFQRFCNSHGISTVEDFLVHNIHSLVALAEHESKSTEFKQGITQILSIIDTMHQPWLNGEELLRHAHQNTILLSTGCQEIDLLLGGGLREGQVTELVGPSSCGKTQVCLQAAATVAYKYMATVLYLDTSNSFSSRRIACSLDRLANPYQKQSLQAKQKSMETIMSNISRYSVFDIFGLLGILNNLELKLRTQVKTGDGKLRLLIIDSISALISPILGGGGAHGHSLMVSAGFLLKKIAHEHNLSVLVTNHTVGGEGGSSKPALGESWKNVSHVQLLLSRDHRSNLCTMSILKHPCMASNQAVEFTILD